MVLNKGVYNFNICEMKKAITILVFSSLIISLLSCDKANDESIDFFKVEYRAGLWISPDKRDTLEFIDNSNLIRKGNYYNYEKYLYRIDGEKLFIRLPNSSDETQHPILKVESNSIILGNMYITTGFADNSGTFLKEN